MAKGALLGAATAVAGVATLAAAISLALPPPGDAAIAVAGDGEAPQAIVPVAPEPGRMAAETDVPVAHEPARVPPGDRTAPASPSAAPAPAPAPPADARPEPSPPQATTPTEPRPTRPAASPAQSSRITLVPQGEVVEAPPAPPTVSPEPEPEAAPEIEARAPVPPTPLPRFLVLDSARADGGGEARAMPRTGALLSQAVPFEPPAGKPLLAIVLREAPPPDAATHEALAALGLPLTLAIDPGAPGAAGRARAGRASGHEIAALAPPPAAGATAQDVEVALAASRAAVPQAVALLEREPGGYVVDRRALVALLPALADAGMGLVVPPGGLGGAVAEARRAGVPAAALFRTLGRDGEPAEAIARQLARAAFEAGRSGPIIVMAEATAETAAGIALWARSAEAADVAAVPLSAVLLSAGDAP